MNAVCKEAEAAIFYRNVVLDMEMVAPLPLDPSDSVAKAVVEAATCSEAALIVTLTLTGNSTRLISKHRPRCPILVLASDAHVGAACNLHRGCIPFLASIDSKDGNGMSASRRHSRLPRRLGSPRVAT